jgi:hypothetical protein
MTTPEGVEWFEFVVGIVALVAAFSCPLALRKPTQPREWSTFANIVPMATIAFVYLNRALDVWELSTNTENVLIGSTILSVALLLAIHVLNGSVNRWIDSVVARIFK